MSLMHSTFVDALPSSLMDSNVRINWKQWKSKKLRHAPCLALFGGGRGMLELWVGTRRVTSINYSHGLTQNQTQCGYCMLEHFWCEVEARTTQTHKTHHGLDLGEATTFPLIVYFVPLHEAHIQMAFISRLPSGSPEICQS
jgi:hypothetical protein